jgi:hypothetical protein
MLQCGSPWGMVAGRGAAPIDAQQHEGLPWLHPPPKREWVRGSKGTIVRFHHGGPVFLEHGGSIFLVASIQ